MRKLYNSKNKVIARRLRKNMTKEERHLWYDYLRRAPQNFVRQRAIGEYIVDFYCGAAKIVIEVDGSQHYEEKGVEKDKERDEYLSELGIRVIRYTNSEINLQFEAVCDDIKNKIEERMEL